MDNYTNEFFLWNASTDNYLRVGSSDAARQAACAVIMLYNDVPPVQQTQIPEVDVATGYHPNGDPIFPDQDSTTSIPLTLTIDGVTIDAFGPITGTPSDKRSCTIKDLAARKDTTTHQWFESDRHPGVFYMKTQLAGSDVYLCFIKDMEGIRMIHPTDMSAESAGGRIDFLE